MEHVTQAWQIVFLAGLGIVAFGVLSLWFYFGVRGGQVDEVSASQVAAGIVQSLLDWRASVKRSAPVMSPGAAAQPQTAQTDQTRPTDRPGSEADGWLDRLELDRTRTVLIELMVYSGWSTGEIRGVIKGDNSAIGAEVEAARKRLGIVAEPRMLRVKDDKGERHIPMEPAQST